MIVNALTTVATVDVGALEGQSELDSHADTCIVGSSSLVFHDYGRRVNIQGYDPNLGIQRDLPIVSAALAYDSVTEAGHETVLLIVNQAIYLPQLKHNLLCPNQMRANDVIVDECPRMFATVNECHRIMIRGGVDDTDASNITKIDGITIPLHLSGVISYFPSRKPTKHEFDTLPRYHLTADEPEWDPHSPTFAQTEERILPHALRMSSTDHRHSISSFGLISVPQCKFLQGTNYFVNVSTTATSTRKSTLHPERLARNWGIGIEAAKRTLQATTQRGIRTISNPALSRRFRTNDRQLRYRRLRCDLFTDTLESSLLSKRQNRYAQIYGSSWGWARAFPMKKKSEAHETLSQLFARDGVPNSMIMDGAKEQVMGDFRRKCREASCHVKQTEPHTPWSNAAEGVIRELKRGVARKMVESKAPKRLWDDCLELEAYIRSHTAHNIYGLEGEVPQTLVTGETPDISEFSELRWYDWVKFRDTSVSFPEDKVVLGRYLGPSFDIGPAMTAKLLKENGQYVHRSTYRPLTDDELKDPLEMKARELFDQKIVENLGPRWISSDNTSKVDNLFEHQDDDIVDETPEYERYEDDDGQQGTYVTEADDATPDTYDPYVGADVILPLGQQMLSGRVIERKRNSDGSMKGRAHHNPILDTRSYQVKFPDGQEAEFAANMIAENMYSQCDIDGNQFLLLDSIVDHKSDQTAVRSPDRYVIINGRQYPKKTTAGWKLCVQWKDGSTSWERLADLKESNPIEVAEYSVSANIQHEPAFAWWVPNVISRRNRIIATVNKRYLKRTHKFGIEIPKTVQRAIEIDRENGNSLWQDAINKEMRNVRIAFHVLDEGQSAPPGHQYMKCHMVFDVKMEDFRRKAWLVAGGHMTETPATLTYASVVSRESVRIALTLAALNDLEVKTGDIENAYLTAPVSEKIWTTCGPEFGSQQGRIAVIVRALYGLKSAGASFRNHLADCMRELGYQSCLADADVWYKAETRPSDGHKYYAYVLLYVDDAMCIHHDAATVLDNIDTFFKFKPGSIDEPDIYLGAKLRRVKLPNLVEAWAISPSKYIQEAVRNIKGHLEKIGRKLPKKASAPLPRDYVPELDTTPELTPDEAAYFQSQIGILRWAVEIGRIDIITEVSMLASHLALPRQGHLDAVYHIFAYLDNKHNTRLVMDPTYPMIDMTKFKECDWREFYGDVKEAIPPNAPLPRGKEVDLRLFVDSDHAGDKLTRRSRSGFIIYMNLAPIIWFSKKQSTIETSVFGAEFVAMKQGMETSRGIRYKLRTMGESLTCHIPTDQNPADLCTKIIPGGAKREHLVSLILYDIFD